MKEALRFDEIFFQWTPFFKDSFSASISDGDDHHEIQRQNRITEQILTNFFERKLFPNRKPKPAPTVEEILPLETRPQRNKHSTHKDNHPNDDDDTESDNLQSVESEHVDTFYRSGEFLVASNILALLRNHKAIHTSSTIVAFNT
jgi:hypothetical protein